MIRRGTAALLLGLAMLSLGGCGWRGLNSLPLPGSVGNGPGSFTIHAQLPDVGTLEQNSRVQVGDVTVGNVTKIERQAWHALLTIRLNGDVDLPANATATIGQTSLLGSLHIELAAPTDVAPQGKLTEGSLIPLASAGSYPSTEQTLAAISLLLNGGGIGQIQDITESLSTALAGRADDVRSLIEQLDRFTGSVADQTGDILAATDSLNNLVGQLADQRPVLDRALQTVPNALAILKQERQQLVEALDQIGKFSALAADSANQTKENLVKELKDLGPGAGIAGQRRPGPDPLAGSAAHLSLPERHHQQVGPRRLRQPDRDHRPDSESARRLIPDRHPVRGQSDRARVAVGPHHRAAAESGDGR